MGKHNASLQWNTASAPQSSFAVLEQRANELPSPSTYAQTFLHSLRWHLLHWIPTSHSQTCSIEVSWVAWTNRIEDE